MNDFIISNAGFLVEVFCLALLAVAVMCVVTSIFTEFIKELPPLKNVPTLFMVLIIALIVCFITFLMTMSYFALPVYWYYIPAVIFFAFVVAIVTARGWDYLAEIVKKYFNDNLNNIIKKYFTKTSEKH